MFSTEYNTMRHWPRNYSLHLFLRVGVICFAKQTGNDGDLKTKVCRC